MHASEDHERRPRERRVPPPPGIIIMVAMGLLFIPLAALLPGYEPIPPIMFCIIISCCISGDIIGDIALVGLAAGLL